MDAIIGSETPEQLARRVRHQVFSRMQETRPGKYDARRFKAFYYLMLLQTRGNILEAKARTDLLVSYYVVMRLIDDSIDAALPHSAEPRSEHILRMIDFAQDGKHPHDDAQILIGRCYSLAERLGFSLIEETISILEAMLFDAKRIEAAEKTGHGIAFSRQELEDHFYLQEGKGVFQGMLKLFQERPEKYKLLSPLVTAHSTKMSLRDLVEDLGVRIVNVPAEAMETYGILQKDLMAVSQLPQHTKLEILLATPGLLSDGVREWVRVEAVSGLGLLAQHRQVMDSNQFRTLGRILLKFSAERSARNYFHQVLSAYHSQPV